MTCTLPPGYDAWRLTPPWDMQPRRGYVPRTVEAPITIETPDVHIDVIGTYCTENGSLLSVRINGRDVAPHVIEALMGPDLGRELDDLDGEELDRLIREAASAYEDERGDYEYERQQEARQ